MPSQYEQNYAVTGLNTDNQTSQIKPGMLTDALNANVSNFDGQSISFGNEQGNVFCWKQPEGYQVIGVRNITQINTVLYWLTNPTTSYSIIGSVVNNNCVFIPILDDSVFGSDSLNLNIYHPILKSEVKTTNCSTQVYWTDKYNNRRYLDLNNLPWKNGIVGQIDTNKMLVQPNFTVPEIIVNSVDIGGTIVEGCYQFAAQYADAQGEGLTGFYSVTNPVRIFLDNHMSPNYNEVTNKSINVTISNLDNSGLYSYFNLAVIKSINGAVAGVDLVGTYAILNNTYNHIYTGVEHSRANIKLSMFDIMEKFNYYDIAGDITQVDDSLVWADLKKEDDNNYQNIWSKVNIGWGTWQVPDSKTEGYFNGANCANIQSYHRDEVYALEGCLLFANGKETPRGHIPGRIATAFDLELISISNKDAQVSSPDPCNPPTISQPRWKVYNTGSVSGLDPNYIAGDDCYKGPFEYGLMGYHESTELYPNNVAVYGSLANTPIRHHRFPDSLITHIHDQNPHTIGTDLYNNYVHKIYPIGFKIDVQSLYQAIQSSTSLTNAEKRQIVGFKIMRSDRRGNETIIAKGLLYNTGTYSKEGSTYFYPNYPFNDVNPDSFISSTYVENKSGKQYTGNQPGNRLNNFNRGRYTFHSPDTHFFQPSGIQGSFLKLETIEFGQCKSHFVQITNNAGEKLRTKKVAEVALAAGITSMLGLNASTTTVPTFTVTVSPTFNAQNFFPTYNTALEFLDKLIPYTNYGWQYNGTGFYGNYIPIPNENTATGIFTGVVGLKQRYIQNGGYVISGLNGTFGDIHPINCTNRESSVYLNIGDNELPYSFENVPTSPRDNSRVTALEAGVPHVSTPFFRDIASYYASIKRYLPGQYGEIFSYASVDTGFTSNLFVNDQLISDPIIFGGDIFINRFALKIKHPFFLNNTVNKVDGSDINYNQDKQSLTNTGNVGYPIWYYSTMNELFTLNTTSSGQLTNFINTFTTTAGIIGSIVTLGLLPLVQAMIFLVDLINNGVLTILGMKITNLESANYDSLNEQGQSYLYAYGIINYFVESEVNVDMRQALNQAEGNFYPNVGSDIPDQWLQETNVPIVWDNTYYYNQTFSKQNEETTFTTIRPDFSPKQPCYINFNNRVIWSDKSSLEETKNHWLVYRPANQFNLPKNYGKTTAVDKLENRSVLVRYEDNFEIYNVLATVSTTALTASLGTGALFSGSQPIQGSQTDTGTYGSQHKFLLRTENGHIYIDAKRGQVILLRGNNTEELSSEKYLNSKFFHNNLNFKILKVFPDVDIDNNFNGIGLHGTYDNYYKRLIITKLDYLPIDPNIKYDGSNFYLENVFESGSPSTEHEVKTCCPDGYNLSPIDISPTYPLGLACFTEGPTIPPIACGFDAGIPNTKTCCPEGYEYIDVQGYAQFCWNPILFQSTDPIDCPPAQQKFTTKTIIYPTDPKYFCNKSWTMSFSFITNTWISKHSYMPNYYIPYEDYFQSGKKQVGIWDHNSTYSIFNNFYGIDYDYILEYPMAYKDKDEILQNIKDYCTVLKYTDYNNFIEPNETIYFDKCIIYNNQQNTGVRVLVPKSQVNLAQQFLYPKFNTDNTEILVSKSDHYYNINMLWDSIKDQTVSAWLDNCTPELGSKDLNQDNIDYGVRSFKKYPLRAKELKIRYILSDKHNYKLISKFILVQNQKSIK